MKKRAAEEAQKARLKEEKRDAEAEKDYDEAKLKDEGQQEGKVKALMKEEEEEEEGTKEEAAEEKSDSKAGGDNNVSISLDILNNHEI